MKFIFSFIAIFLFVGSVAEAKIVMMDGKAFIRKDGKQSPLFTLNELIEKKKVKKVNLYGEGRVHMVSFAIKGESEKLYSVDNRGFIYSIDPFSKYEVSTVKENGKFRFKEVPEKLFRITENGYFIH